MVTHPSPHLSACSVMFIALPMYASAATYDNPPIIPGTHIKSTVNKSISSDDTCRESRDILQAINEVLTPSIRVEVSLNEDALIRNFVENYMNHMVDVPTNIATIIRENLWDMLE